MPRLLSAHKPSRLIFAVFTLAVAISGVIANYSLSHNAIRVFRAQLALGEEDRFLLTGALSDIVSATKGRLDAGSFEDGIGPILMGTLPKDMRVFFVSARQGELSTPQGPRPVRLIAANDDLFNVIGAVSPSRTLLTKVRRACAPGARLAPSLPDTDHFVIDGRYCYRLEAISVTDTPPFVGLGNAVFISDSPNDFANDVALRWSLFIFGPSGSMTEADLRDRLAPVMSLDRVEVWSGAQVADRAQRLLAIVRLIANGLGLVILLVGGASIASLMSFSVAERAREIAIKRTIGASRAQVIAEIISEALVIGIVATLVGIVGGYTLAQHLEAPLGEFLAVGLREGESFSVLPIIHTVAAFLLVCIAAGALPAWHATSRDPASVLRNA